MELIYVVVPVYKVEPYIHRCIDSILNQTYQNFRLLLVDDGSPDNCPAICDEYAKQDSRIQVIHQKNGGLSVARNAGIDYAMQQGDPENNWISFIDSDDFVHPKYLEYLYRAAKESGAEVSSCGYIRTSSSKIESEKSDLVYTTLSPEEFWIKGRINATVAWGKLYKLHCFDQILYPVGKLHEDEFTTYRILFQFSAIAFVDTPLYDYYFNNSSITHTVWDPKRLAQLEALNLQLQFFRKNGFPCAYRQSCRALLQNSIKQWMFSRNLFSNKHPFVIKTGSWKNYAFQLYAKDAGFFEAVVYWFRIRFIEPAKRILGKESLFSFLKRRIKKMLHIH